MLILKLFLLKNSCHLPSASYLRVKYDSKVFPTNFRRFLCSNKITANTRFVRLNQTNCKIKLNLGFANTIQRCGFKTSSPRYNPLVAIVIRQIAKVVAVFTGRTLRKWWANLPPERRRVIIDWIIRQKWIFFSVFAVLFIGSTAYYYSHIQETPITKRKRFIVFNHKQLEQLADYEFQVLLENLKDKLLPKHHPDTLLVAKIANQLLHGNKDLTQIYEREWSVSVVDDPSVRNAFVFPNGQIFVYSGIIRFCDNQQQLGVILAHEMAHSVLGHSAELASHAHLIDWFFVCILTVIWAILPTDLISALGTYISKLFMDLIIDRPYSRMLETEADIVGLELAAKACFDVRETSAFWDKMSFVEQIEGVKISPERVQVPSTPSNEFLLTHPSHETRSQYLDSIMDEAIKLREKSGCPRLSSHDPRAFVEAMKKNLEREIKRRKMESVLVLPKP